MCEGICLKDIIFFCVLAFSPHVNSCFDHKMPSKVKNIILKTEVTVGK